MNSSSLQLQSYAVGVANNYGIDPAIFLNQINQESGFNQFDSSGNILTSSAGALGIAQILPSTASNPGYGVSSVDPTDPLASINFMGQYDAAMLQRTGSTTGMLEAYNAGLGNLGAGAGYASAIENGPFTDSGVPAATNTTSVSNAGGTYSCPPILGIPIPSWLCGASAAASDGVAAVTGQTTSGVTPQTGAAGIGNAVGAQVSSALNGAVSGFLSSPIWGTFAIGALGIVLILGALFWLASSGNQANTSMPAPVTA